MICISLDSSSSLLSMLAFVSEKTATSAPEMSAEQNSKIKSIRPPNRALLSMPSIKKNIAGGSGSNVSIFLSIMHFKRVNHPPPDL